MASGRESVRELERTLALTGRSLHSFHAVLDFGCGCGRLLLWLESVGRPCELHGTDVDPDAIAWCEHDIPYAHVTVNSEDPPLPYPGGAFDLVYNHSVFTHIDERRQDLWLTELKRVTRPGAVIVLSTHGEWALADGAWQIPGRLEREGIVFVDGSLPNDFPLPSWDQNTLHAPWCIFEHWGRWFRIRGYVPGAALPLQDHTLLERLPDSEVPAPLAARPVLAGQGGLARRVESALAQAQSLRESAKTAPSCFGRVGRLSPTAIIRLLRPYSAHEDDIDAAVATSIGDLTRALNTQAERIEALDRRLDEQP